MFDHHALLYGHLQWVSNNQLLTLPVCLQVHPFQSSGFLGSLVNPAGCPHGAAVWASTDAPGDFRHARWNYKMSTLLLFNTSQLDVTCLQKASL